MQVKLWDLRKNVKRMTQEEMAQHLGISVVTYRDKEKGRVAFTSDEMFLLSNLFEMKMDDIFLPRSHQNGAKKDKEEVK